MNILTKRPPAPNCLLHGITYVGFGAQRSDETRCFVLAAVGSSGELGETAAFASQI
jgi:hypothetical protein